MVEIYYGNTDKNSRTEVTGDLYNTIENFSVTELPTLLKNYSEPNFISFDGLGIDLLNNNKVFYQENNNYYFGGVFSTISDENRDLRDSSYLTINLKDRVEPTISIKFYGDCCRKILLIYADGTETINVDSDLIVFEVQNKNQELLKII